MNSVGKLPAVVSPEKQKPTSKEHVDHSLPVIALVGNPNVGKTTLFNALTGLRQHTGNWPGKTVSLSYGSFHYKDREFILVDLPGVYSLYPGSPDEEVTRDFLVSRRPQAVVVVADAAFLERSLLLVFQVMQVAPKVILCINLADEVERKGLRINCQVLETELGLPVVLTAARTRRGLDELRERIEAIILKVPDFRISSPAVRPDFRDGHPLQEASLSQAEDIVKLYRKAEGLARKAVIEVDKKDKDIPSTWLSSLDRILASRWASLPLISLLMGMVFWLTLVGANYPSELLSLLFARLEEEMLALAKQFSLPSSLQGFVIEGVYRTAAFVVAVMLPPMAIFYPCFTFLEELGYLPRVAFDLDGLFQRVGTCGRQALTMGMGLGCNAAGVAACRIIGSPRERVIAMLTNVFVPCNGRFPLLISLAHAFFAGRAGGGLVAAAAVTGVVVVGVLVTLATSWVLSRVLVSGLPSTFALELPPFRWPRIGNLLARSLLDRTLFVLGRAVTVAAPFGGLIWVLANIHIGAYKLLDLLAGYLEPGARLLGLDGWILLAFILALPANELVLPVLLMLYLKEGTLIDLENGEGLRSVLIGHGWTWATALSVMLFSLLHYPCATTLFSIYKETGSIRWTVRAFVVPLGVAVLILLLLNNCLIRGLGLL